MLICPVCGAETEQTICTSCGASVYDDNSQRANDRYTELLPRRERIARPPAPKNQPALLHDASPVFSPVSAYSLTAEEDSFPEELCEPEDKPIETPDDLSAEIADDVGGEYTPQTKSESATPDTNSTSEIAEDDTALTDAAAEEIYDPVLSDDTLTDDTAVAAEIGIAAAVISASDAYACTISEDIDGDDEPDGLTSSASGGQLPSSLRRVLDIIADMLRGEFSTAARKLAERNSTACWQWLLPLNFILAISGLGLCGYITADYQTTNRFGSAAGAAALLWSEHFIILLLLFSLLFAIIGCRVRLVRILETVCAAVLPLAVMSVAAALLSLIYAPLGAPLLLFGAILSAFFIYSSAKAVGVSRFRLGKPLTGLIILADIIFTSLLINSII